MSDNPYQSPPFPTPSGAAYVPVPQRPVAATVFGILNLLFGALHLCGILLSAPMYFGSFAEGLRKGNPVFVIFDQNATFRALMTFQMLVGFVLAVVLIVAGIGLLKLQPRGRTWSMGYGAGAIVAVIFGFVINAVYIFGPLLDQLNSVGSGPEKAGAIGGLFGGVFGSCMGLIYPVVLLIFMSRPRFVASFRDAHKFS